MPGACHAVRNTQHTTCLRADTIQQRLRRYPIRSAQLSNIIPFLPAMGKKRRGTALTAPRLCGRMAPAMIRWLDQINQDNLPLAGGKAANLGAMTRAGFPVPPGFCLTTAAWRVFMRACRLDGAIHELRRAAAASTPAETERHAALLREQIERAAMPQEIVEAVRRAYAELPSRLPLELAAAKGDLPVAVRSSATAEDLPTLSFAGQQDTYLDVTGLDDLLRAVRACWASLWTGRAVQYRQAGGVSHDAEVAVVVQAMVPCDVAGVAFSIDPLTGEDAVVIEAVPGLGDALMNGKADPVLYRVSPDGSLSADPGESALLAPREAHRLASVVNLLAEYFGCPQDAEWGYRDGELYLFQSRPITAFDERFFNEPSPDPDQVWTAAFLNERFPQPVSPLGWSIVGSLLEPLAYREPLRYLGVHDLDAQAVTRLYRGHPYTDAGVFWRIHKLFPDRLLPEDAVRYFPGGDISLRKKTPTPRWSPRLLWSVLRAAMADLRNWSPVHNWQVWRRFVLEHEQEMARLAARTDAALAALAEMPHDREKRLAVYGLLEEGQELSHRLLRIHRWSLVHADLTYTLLRRLCVRVFGHDEGPPLAARQVTRLHTRSFLLDQALRNLADRARRTPALRQALNNRSWAELAAQLPTLPGGPSFRDELERFLAEYGHRAYSLDIFQPTFRDDPFQVLALVRELLRDDGLRAAPAADAEKADAQRRMPWFLRPLASLAQRYVLLREEQRFLWQRTLALQRRLVTGLGDALAQGEHLDRAGDVFFLTLAELRQAASGTLSAGGRTARQRRLAHADLQREHTLAPSLSYPEFLRGDTPLPSTSAGRNSTLRGRPVSPGIARGLVRVIRSPGDFEKLRPGDILVTASPDPGWTPVFGIIAGLVMERGGQLSHGAVVAREYGLPAVAGLSGATTQFRDGEWILVDGRTGVVQREE